ncbi:MAG: transposase [Prosthecobacter sp.]
MPTPPNQTHSALGKRPSLVPVKFFNPFEEIRVTENQLPHWQQPGAAYFITFRMADALPERMLHDLELERTAWLQTHEGARSIEDEAEYHRLFSARVDQCLDAGHGSCVLRQPRMRAAIVESFEHFNHDRYELLSYVIMPNHVHALMVQHPDWLLEKILFTWKRRTAGVINEALGVEGKFWQKDYFDRLIRDGDHLRNVIRYIRRNPAKAHLPEEHFTLWESKLAKSVEG